MILDDRLSAAASMVPQGARLADIGSDHAYLPIALCLSGQIECALASDINDGPVASAIANIQKNGVCDRVRAIKADGLWGAKDFCPDCITVLGMGGELIVSILDAAPWIKNKGITLVLQPMTHPEILAEYLASSGCETVDEKMVCDGGRSDRIYRIIRAKYTGEPRQIDEIDAIVGRINLRRADSATVAYVKRLIRVYEARVCGKKSSGRDASDEERLVRELKREIGEKENESC